MWCYCACNDSNMYNICFIYMILEAHASRNLYHPSILMFHRLGISPTKMSMEVFDFLICTSQLDRIVNVDFVLYIYVGAH